MIFVYHDTLLSLASLEQRQRFNQKYLLFLKGLTEEMAKLVPENFMELYDPARLAHIIRYLKAVSIRGERALVSLEKDQTKAGLINEHEEHLNSFLQGLSPGTTKEKRTKIEELFFFGLSQHDGQINRLQFNVLSQTVDLLRQIIRPG